MMLQFRKLIQRYDNISLVIQLYIRAILDSPRVEEVSASGLQTFHSHVAALKALKQPRGHWVAWSVTIIRQ